MTKADVIRELNRLELSDPSYGLVRRHGKDWEFALLPRDETLLWRRRAGAAECLKALYGRTEALEAIYYAVKDVFEYESGIDNMRHNRRVSKEWAKLEDLVDDFREKFE